MIGLDYNLIDAVVEDLEDGLILVDATDRALHWNPAALALHGYMHAEHAPADLEALAAAFELLAEDGVSLPPARRPIARVLQGERIRDVEVLLRRKEDGWERSVSYSGRLIPSGAGAAQIAVMSVRDLTESKRSEVQFRQNETLLQLAYEAADLGIWQNNRITGEVVFDARSQRHYGFAGDRVMLADVIGRIVPEDAGRLVREIEEATSAGSPGRFATEYRVRHDDGSVHWLLVHVRVVFAGEGAQRRAVVGYGTSQDITEQKRVEEALLLRTEELARILDMLPAAIWIADDPGCLQVRGNRYANHLLRVETDSNVSQSEGADTDIRLRHYAGGRELAVDDLPLQKAVRTGEPQVDVEMRIERPGVADVILIGGAMPLRDAD